MKNERSSDGRKSRSLTGLGVAAALGLAAPRVMAAPAPGEITFTGMCDASGAVPVDDKRFAVANDEDNVVRVYDAQRGGAPLQAQDLSPELPLRKNGSKGAKAKPRKDPESDIEAATLLKDTAYWLTSHGRNSKGKVKPARFIVFATSLPKAGEPLAITGQPYQGLLQDFVETESLRALNLGTASERAPKQEGALNVEGLTATADGKGMYIGLRNPLHEGRAILIPWANPSDVVSKGSRAQLGAPVFLDLGGQGVRSLSWWRGQYLIVAGHHADGGTSHLYTWDGRGAPRRLPVDFTGFNPEGFFTPENRDQILVMSDDGGVEHGGTACKDLEDPAQKRFRARWVQVPPANVAAKR
ncbi:MAG TPA: DUF3616 domain-containing protein [Polyangia bacterium]